MASNAGGLKVIAPTFGSVVVTLTTPNATTPIVYSDAALTTTVALPVTVAQAGTQTIFLAGSGTYVLSVLYGAQQIADPRQGATQTLDFSPGEMAVRDYSGIVQGVGAAASVIEAINSVAASGAAVTIPDPSASTISKVTLTAACTFTFPTAAAGKSFTLALTQDATGSRLATWPGTVKWQGGVAPILSTGATKVDALSFMCVDGTNWYGFIAGLDIR